MEAEEPPQSNICERGTQESQWHKLKAVRVCGCLARPRGEHTLRAGWLPPAVSVSRLAPGRWRGDCCGRWRGDRCRSLAGFIISESAAHGKASPARGSGAWGRPGESLKCSRLT